MPKVGFPQVRLQTLLACTPLTWGATMPSPDVPPAQGTLGCDKRLHRCLGLLLSPDGKDFFPFFFFFSLLS
jgi:hypothetical protein